MYHLAGWFATFLWTKLFRGVSMDKGSSLDWNVFGGSLDCVVWIVSIE